MVELERLTGTAERLIECLDNGGLAALDEQVKLSRATSAAYRYTYDRFVQYFRDRAGEQPLDEQDLYVGFACAHSWMATIKQLDPRIETSQAALAALNNLRDAAPGELGVGQGAGAERLDELRAAIEPLRHFLGSVSATSKLLHFASPEVFPIWDTTVHRYAALPEQASTADSLGAYAHYVDAVHRLAGHAEFDSRIYQPLLQALERAYDAADGSYRRPAPIGRVRSIEYTMFYGGRVELGAAGPHVARG